MKVSIGQDSHRFDFENKEKKLVLGGVIFENENPMKANSDGDVILHAITNAISRNNMQKYTSEKWQIKCVKVE